MLKQKKSNKVLVRNPSVPIRTKKQPDKPLKLKKVHFVNEEETPEEEVPPSNEFISPEPCTLLQFAKELRKIKNSFPSTHSLPEGPRYRNLNFLPEEKIFQDLVDIELPERKSVIEVRSQPCVRASVKKDPEPDVNKYLKYDLGPEYYFTSSVVPLVPKQEPVFDGCDIYNKLNQWKKRF